MSKKGAHILVVDDDSGILTTLRNALETNGYEVYTAKSGSEALEKIARHKIDLMVLDLMLPNDKEGLEVFEKVHAQTHALLPVIVLSVWDDSSTKVQALDLGVDDYVVKPFDTPELLARIRSKLLRIYPTGSVFITGPLKVDFSLRSVQIDGNDIDLAPVEYEILKVMIHHRGQVITPKMLLSLVWRGAFGFNPQHVYVYIHNLRKKIEPDMTKPRFIHTVYRIGYRFTNED